MVEIKNVTKKYDNSKGIFDVSLSIEDNTIHALIGINGAGKSTLIKCLTTNIRKFEGEILIDGEDNFKKTAKRNLAFLPEVVQPHEIFTGMEFLEYNVLLNDESVDLGYVEYLCERLEFDKSNLKRAIKTYSKGMRQKISLIATIATKAKHLILDEPMSGLDPLARKNLKNLLMELKNERTIFFASHILAEVDEMADVISIMHNGNLVFSGAVDSDLEAFFINKIKDG